MLAVMLAACGGATAPGAAGPTEVPFTEHASTQQSGRDDTEPAVVVGADAAATMRDVAIPSGRVAIAVLQGQQRTGGYGIQVQRVVRTGTTLEVRAAFAAPAADAIVIQVLTSPAQLISVAHGDVSGVTRVVLVDDTGTERASTAASLP